MELLIRKARPAVITLLLTVPSLAQQVSPSIFDNGNVGIGTTTPQAKLDISGDVMINSGFRTKVIGPISFTSSVVVDLGYFRSGNIINVDVNMSGNCADSAFYYRIAATAWGQTPVITNADSADVCNQYFTNNNFYWKMDPNNSDYGYLYLQSGTSANGDTKTISIKVSADSSFSDATTGHTGFSLVPVAISISNNPQVGNVGIGTTNPLVKLDVRGDTDIFGSLGGLRVLDPNTTVVGGISRYATNGGTDLWASGFRGASGSLTSDLYFSRFSGSSWADVMVLQNSTGNVGIGTTTPTQKLEVYGSLKLSSSSSGGGSVMFPDGSSQNTAWTGVLCGGDYAESVEVSGEHSHYEPGDVLVIDTSRSEGFAKSAEPYSSTIAGIYSTKPGAIGRRTTDPDKIKSEIPMAMVGIVPTKVSAENGPIRRGDLLVTASTPGRAMKGTDRMRITGAIVGKALGNLDSGMGVIDVLVSLQ